MFFMAKNLRFHDEVPSFWDLQTSYEYKLSSERTEQLSQHGYRTVLSVLYFYSGQLGRQVLLIELESTVST